MTYPYGAAVDTRSPRGSPDAGRLVLNRGDARGVQFATRAHAPAASFSTSFGAAGEALAGPPPSRRSDSTIPEDVKPRMSYTMPAGSSGAMDAAARQYGISGRGRGEQNRQNSVTPPPPQLVLPTGGSPSSSGTDPESDSKDASGAHAHQTLHKCESCSKVYRHPSCLIKHRWEHTMYWKEASKFLMSKHQQVQLLEAAAILVGMDSNARSLPEEKALWPAAVSPPESGLLGCDQVNFDKLMASKMRNAAQYDTRMPYGTSAPPTSSGLRNSPRMQPHMGSSPRMRPNRHDDIDEEVGEESLDIPREDAYGLNSGGDMMADMVCIS